MNLKQVINKKDFDILFDKRGKAISSSEITECIQDKSWKSYNNTVASIIETSNNLDKKGKVFEKNLAILLPNFKMTRNGIFHGIYFYKNKVYDPNKILKKCWDEIGSDLIKIRKKYIYSYDENLRGRVLLQFNEKKRNEVIEHIWNLFKRLLPITKGKTFSLVGASKILFTALPEIVLPIDNQQWLELFETIDIGDVINRMALEIKYWEKEIKEHLNECGNSNNLSTLPAIYNVMAMEARYR